MLQVACMRAQYLYKILIIQISAAILLITNKAHFIQSLVTHTFGAMLPQYSNHRYSVTEMLVRQHQQPLCWQGDETDLA